MDEKKLNHKPYVSGKPVEAEPNRVREKAYKEPNAPEKARKADKGLPDGEARDKVSEGMGGAADNVKKQL